MQNRLCAFQQQAVLEMRFGLWQLAKDGGRTYSEVQ